jgi:integrase
MFRIFRPTYTDRHGNRQQCRVWWMDLHIRGRRVRESTKTRDRKLAESIARAREAELLLAEAAPSGPRFEEAFLRIAQAVETLTAVMQAIGLPPAPLQIPPSLPAAARAEAPQPEARPLDGSLASARSLEARPLPASSRTLAEACESFLKLLSSTRSRATVDLAQDVLQYSLDFFGAGRRTGTIGETDVAELIDHLQRKGLSARTVNLAISHLARALGGTVKSLWPSIRKLRENTDAGRALSDSEIRRLLEEADRLAAGEEKLTVSDSRRGEWTQSSGPRGVLLPCFLRLLLYTGMRSGEAKTLQWRHVDFQKGLISVPGTKTDAARRVIPMHPDLQQVLEKHRAWYGQRFGQMQPDWFVFPAGSPAPSNPRKPVTDFKHGWETVREKSGVQCRMHDLRHTFISRLAESGVPEVTLMELAGHVSRNMMLRYSHPRIEARREAVQAIKL